MQAKKFKGAKYPLKNQGKLTIYFVGSGSAFAKTINQNNILVTKGNDHLLVDCGNKATQALHGIGLSVVEISNYLITHSHADHIGGLEEVMMFGRYVTQKKPNIVITEEYQNMLWNETLKGGSAYSEIHDGKCLDFTDFWEILRPRKCEECPRETWEIDVGSINIKMPRTMHIPDNANSWEQSQWSCGVIIDNRAFFTSDTRFDPDLILKFEKKFNFEYIFHDCQFFNGGVHASIEELSTFPKEIKKKMYLMHYGDNWKNFLEQAKKAGFKGFAKQGFNYIFD